MTDQTPDDEQTAEPSCSCQSPDEQLRAVLEGRSVPACERHGSVAYTPPPATASTPSESTAWPALNSDALLNSLSAALGGTTHTTDI